MENPQEDSFSMCKFAYGPQNELSHIIKPTLSITDGVSQGVFKLHDDHSDVVKFCQEIFEYLNEFDKLFMDIKNDRAYISICRCTCPYACVRISI